MEQMFVAPPETEEDCPVQISESAFRQGLTGSTERFDLAYRQVWLYAMRHYPSMPPELKRKDNLIAQSNRAKADERVVYEMAELAQCLGFHSDEIRDLVNQSPDRQIARAALLQAKKPGCFQYDARVFETLID
ncbi:hypothetical protein AJ80_09955 [Polytolypa hystricis UAMH7299]|uniref:Uncharacterized protein n=1 Tax=Polytolypa hystricis (strain UAMH7299) TaxID=1447883 RepID=A0A2B7WG38_POLH7|nr:hypothetical protein AJ80_09955 [Polytolypa hystricis UAMH7299]